MERHWSTGVTTPGRMKFLKPAPKTPITDLRMNVPTNKNSGWFARMLLLAFAATMMAPTLAGPFFWINPNWDEIKSTVRETFPQLKIITTPELLVLLRAEAATKPLLLDVRERAEYDDSHLLGAINAASLSAAEAALKSANVELSRTIVVYCSVGYRSGAIADRLRRNGYLDVRNYDGSIFEWANSGQPVFRGSEQVRTVHPYSRTWGKLLKRELWSREP